MRSLIKWKVLLGLLIALTIAFFIFLLVDLKSNQDKARVIIMELKESVQTSQVTNDKLGFLLDSITTESAHLEARVVFLEAQKDSLSKGISRPPIGVKVKSGLSNQAQDYYMNCENIVQIDIPKKYASKKLKYSSDHARILETPDHGRIIIFPLHRIVHIIIESEGTEISKIELPPVKNVPLPTYHVYNGIQKIDLKQGAVGRTLSSLTLVAVPEPNFQKAVPKDARYHIKRWDMVVTRGSTVIFKREVNSETLDQSLDLKSERSLLKPGDIVHLNAVEVFRINFRDKKDMISTSGGSVTFPIL